MLVKSTILTVLAAVSALSLAAPAATGVRVTLSIGAVALAYDGTGWPDPELQPACFATPCPIARLRIARTGRDTPVYRAGYAS